MVEGEVLESDMCEGEPCGESGGGEECVPDDFELEFGGEEGELRECGKGFHRELNSIWV